MNKSLALISTLLLAAGALSATSTQFNLVTSVGGTIAPGFYEDVNGTVVKTNLSLSEDKVTDTAYLIVSSNTSTTMDLEAQLPALVWEQDENETMPYRTTIRLISSANAQFTLNADASELQNSDEFQTFGQMKDGNGTGVYAFDFSIDTQEFSSAHEGEYVGTVNVQIKNL